MAPKPWPTLSRQRPTYPPMHISILRVVPTFFVIGVCIELFMQKVPIGGRTFYDVALQKEVSAALPPFAPTLLTYWRAWPVGAEIYRAEGRRAGGRPRCRTVVSQVGRSGLFPNR